PMELRSSHWAAQGASISTRTYDLGLPSREEQIPVTGVLHVPKIPGATHDAGSGVGLIVQQQVTNLVGDHMPEDLSRIRMGVRNLFHGKFFYAVVDHVYRMSFGAASG